MYTTVQLGTQIMTSPVLKHSLEEVSVGRVRYERAPGSRSVGQGLVPSIELLVAVTLCHRIETRPTIAASVQAQ